MCPRRVLHGLGDCVRGSLSDPASVGNIDAAHPGLGRELDEPAAGRGLQLQSELAARQLDDALALRRGVGERGHRGQPCQLALGRSLHGYERRRAAIAQRDRAGLVQQQRVHVAGNLDGLAALGDQVRGQRTVHPRDPDRRQQCADGRGDQTHQQRDQASECPG